MALTDTNATTNKWRSTAILLALREANIQVPLEMCHGLATAREAPIFYEWHAEGTAPLQPSKFRVITRLKTKTGTSSPLLAGRVKKGQQ